MTATTISPEIIAFARAVREALDDLPAEEVDDLTDGLEADLTESAAESRSTSDDEADADQLGDPDDYAAELRAAAGFAPRIRRARRISSAGLTAWFDELRDNFVRRANSTKNGAVVWSFLVTLRPVWWIARGWAVYQLLTPIVLFDGFVGPVPSSFIGWTLLGLAVVLSVQWGRGRWLNRRWLRVGKAMTTAVAIVALPFFAAAIPQSREVQYVESASEPVTGLARDGQPIGNIFAYDSSGTLLSGVQLFDQNGRPLSLISGEQAASGYLSFYSDDGASFTLVPSDATPGGVGGWNVYPLSEIDEADLDYDAAWGNQADQAIRRDPRAPFAQVQPLAEPTTAEMNAMPGAPSPSPSVMPEPSPSDPLVPSATPSPGATPSPSPTP